MLSSCTMSAATQHQHFLSSLVGRQHAIESRRGMTREGCTSFCTDSPDGVCQWLVFYEFHIIVDEK